MPPPPTPPRPRSIPPPPPVVAAAAATTATASTVAVTVAKTPVVEPDRDPGRRRRREVRSGRTTTDGMVIGGSLAVSETRTAMGGGFSGIQRSVGPSSIRLAQMFGPPGRNPKEKNLRWCWSSSSCVMMSSDCYDVLLLLFVIVIVVVVVGRCIGAVWRILQIAARIARRGSCCLLSANKTKNRYFYSVPPRKDQQTPKKHALIV